MAQVIVILIVLCGLGDGLIGNGGDSKEMLLLVNCSEKELDGLLLLLSNEDVSAFAVTSSSAEVAVSVVGAQWSKAAALARQSGLDPYDPRLSEAAQYFVRRQYDRAWQSTITYLRSLGPLDESLDALALLDQIRFRSAHDADDVLPIKRDWEMTSLPRDQQIRKLAELMPYATGEITNGRLAASYWTSVASANGDSGRDPQIDPFIELLRLQPTLLEFELIVDAFAINLAMMPPNNTNRFAAIGIDVDSRSVLCDIFNRVAGEGLRSGLLAEKQWRQPDTVKQLLRRHAN